MGGFFGGGGASVANLVGATSSVAGTAGLVPAPAAGEENRQLLGSGSFIHTSPFNLTNKSNRFTFHTINTCLQFRAGTTGTLSNNKIYFSPIFLNFSFEFDRIIFANRSGNPQTNTRFGVYSHDRSSGLPKSLIVESANVASISGNTNIETAVSATTLSADVYWLCFVCNSSFPISRAATELDGFKFSNFLIGGANSSSLANWGLNNFDFTNTFSYDHTYSGTQALPTSLTPSLITNNISNPPFMAIRKS